MKNKTQKLVNAVEGWINDEGLQHAPGLEALRPDHPDHGLSSDQVMERNEFIAWYLDLEMGLLLQLPAPKKSDRFFLADLVVTDADYGAFHTHDFQRFRTPINLQELVKKKLASRVVELAIFHSCLSTKEGQTNIENRFKRLLEDEFKGLLDNLAKKLHYVKDSTDQARVRRVIGCIQKQIWVLNQIWARHAQAP